MINKNLVLINESLDSRDQVIQKVIDKAYELKLINNKKLFHDAIYERETEIPTSVGFGVAIPHGKSENVNEVFVAFVKTENQFLWDDRNGEFVDSIFLMGLPKENGDRKHLLLLSQISRKLMNEDFRNSLQACETKEEAFNLLSTINDKL